MPINFLPFRKTKPQDEKIIIVSGLPRSGTSMMMKMLAAGGLETLTDHLRIADESNPKGYYELERVKKMAEGDKAWVKEGRGRVIKVISALLEHLPLDERYRVIFMRRKMDEVLASQRQMLLREGKPTDQVNDEVMADLFTKHLRKVEAWLAAQPNMEVLYLSYNDTLADPPRHVAQVSQFLGGKLDIPAMLQVVDHNLYRERTG